MYVSPAYCWQVDEADYEMGFMAGKAGSPDPKGRANWATWCGWRDGAAAAGHLPRHNLFSRVIARRK